MNEDYAVNSLNHESEGRECGEVKKDEKVIEGY